MLLAVTRKINLNYYKLRPHTPYPSFNTIANSRNSDNLTHNACKGVSPSKLTNEACWGVP